MDKLLLNEITTALHNAWSSETSNNANWSRENPAVGQCAVTACVIQDYLGGDLLNSVVTFSDGSIDSHYFNIINSEVVDLTRSQFPADATFSEGKPKTKEYSSTREYCLSYEATRKRYDILREKVATQLKR